jgi:hypothetical protein
MPYILRHEVWLMAPARDYPALVHEFRGESRDEAYAAYVVHYEDDPVLNRCQEHGMLGDRACSVKWSVGTEPTGSYMEQAAPTPEVKVRAGFVDPRMALARSRSEMEARTQEFGRQMATDTRIAVVGPPPSPFSSPTSPFSPRVIEGGRGKSSAQVLPERPPGHEDHDPDVCDVRTG